METFEATVLALMAFGFLPLQVLRSKRVTAIMGCSGSRSVGGDVDLHVLGANVDTRRA